MLSDEQARVRAANEMGVFGETLNDQQLRVVAAARQGLVTEIRIFTEAGRGPNRTIFVIEREDVSHVIFSLPFELMRTLRENMRILKHHETTE
jgi:hypothetical protein